MRIRALSSMNWRLHGLGSPRLVRSRSRISSDQTTKQLEMELGRTPSEEEISWGRLGLPTAEYDKLQRKDATTVTQVVKLSAQVV